MILIEKIRIEISDVDYFKYNCSEIVANFGTDKQKSEFENIKDRTDFMYFVEKSEKSNCLVIGIALDVDLKKNHNEISSIRLTNH